MKKNRNHRGNRLWTGVMIALGLLVLSTVPAYGQDRRGGGPLPGQGLGWSAFVEGAYLHQLSGDVDEGGRYDVDRAAIRAGVMWMPDFRRSVSLSFGYGFAGFDFEGNNGLASLNPWDDVHSFGVGAFIRWGLDTRWTLFLAPTVRWTAEQGTDWGDAMTGGGFVGFAYRFGDRLTLGPGVGVLSELEDSASVFPVLFVNWRITDRLGLETGGGLGATQGPGLTLNYDVSPTWRLFMGGRYDKLRFRLDESGPAPAGVGGNRSVPLFGGVTVNLNAQARLTLMAGVDVGGELLLDDEDGRRLSADNYGTTAVLGLAFRFSF
ncbi:MAG: hypothetical protein JXQ27_16185 [Acidobacteria bacterium]|nr:hypothetical protein [Acidobacteriota bacterium]